jgi:hypothetical protein
MAGYGNRYPDADVVLFEPARDAYEMFFGNLFSLTARREVCELAYEMTRADLRHRADELEPILRRHGVRLRKDAVTGGSRRKGTGGAARRRTART